MKIYKEVSGYDFDFWSGARDTVKYLTTEEVEQIFSVIQSRLDEVKTKFKVNKSHKHFALSNEEEN